MSTKLIINCETKEISETNLTPEEIAQREADIAAAVEEQAALEAEEAAKQAARESAIAKFEAMGLTADEIAAIIR